MMAFGKKWFNSASDEELETEREKVRQDYCSSGGDLERASELQETLFDFDREISKRAWGDEEHKGPSFQREHGWYLPNDD